MVYSRVYVNVGQCGVGGCRSVQVGGVGSDTSDDVSGIVSEAVDEVLVDANLNTQPERRKLLFCFRTEITGS